MLLWWASLSNVRKGLVMAGAIIIALLSVLWLTAGGVGDPELCHEVPKPGECETCPIPPEPVPKGDRLLGVDVNATSDVDYWEAFARAQELGMQFTELTLFWDELEPAPGMYDDSILDAAREFYPSQGIQLALTVAPVDAVVGRMPSDLSAEPLDSDAVIVRFNALLTHVFEQLTDVDILVLSIGNEVDAYLGDSNSLWTEYETFFVETAAHARNARPGIKVGVKMKYTGLVDSAAEPADMLNAHADAVLATYYPVNADFTVRPPWQVDEDVGKLVALYPEQELMLLEFGYPTAQLLNSSEELQQDFIGYTFDMWDHYALWLKAICFSTLHDRPADEVDRLAGYYDRDDELFIAFLSTQGLAYADGTTKLGYDTLDGLARVRGW
jgi:hypothetical protein